MKYLGTTTAIVGLCGSMAFAGGIDRSGQSTAVIFEDGRHLEFSFGAVNPSVSGTSVPAGGSLATGDIAPQYTLPGFAYKADINEDWSYAVIFDRPFGASVDYPVIAGYVFSDSQATLDTTAITALVKYTTDQNISIFGGVRAQSMEADISLFGGGYTASGAPAWGTGWIVGAAWEKPEIAARVALTVSSEITHDIETTENVAAASTTSVTTPTSINLDFQTGISQNTLLFGSARYVAWDGFEIAPAGWLATFGAGDPIVSFSNDTISYSLGVGRRVSDNLSVALTAGYEASSGGFSSNLAPTDGNTSLGVAATWTKDNVKISGGLRFVWVGDAQTEITALSPYADFTGNSGLAAGFKVAIALDG